MVKLFSETFHINLWFTSPAALAQIVKSFKDILVPKNLIVSIRHY